jgi:hypothetical protein
MFKKMLLACNVALPLGLAAAAPSASAGDVDIRVRVPFYVHSAPHYRHYGDYGWHGYRYPRYHAYYDYDDDYVVDRPPLLSCGEARRLVRSHGFHEIETRQCEGRNYTFTGVRNGYGAIIHVNSFTGRVWMG